MSVEMLTSLTKMLESVEALKHDFKRVDAHLASVESSSNKVLAFLEKHAASPRFDESTFSNSTAIEGRKKSAQLLSIVTPVRPPARERKKKLGALHSVAGAVVASVRWKNNWRAGGNVFAGGAPKTANEMYALFEKELEVGEKKIAAGDVDIGLKRMANAVALCGEPEKLMMALSRKLPKEIFERLRTKVPRAQQRVMLALGKHVTSECDPRHFLTNRMNTTI